MLLRLLVSSFELHGPALFVLLVALRLDELGISIQFAQLLLLPDDLQGLAILLLDVLDQVLGGNENRYKLETPEENVNKEVHGSHVGEQVAPVVVQLGETSHLEREGDWH